MAVLYAAYVRNRTHTKAVTGKTPYETWTNERPNVSHLCEFGVPVWILWQGVHQGYKMESHAQQNQFMGFNDSSKSVKYYKAETRKILISRNFQFLTLTDEAPPNDDPIAIEVDLQLHILCEGKPENDMQINKSKDPQSDNETQDLSDKRNLWKKPQVNYKHLHNPDIRFLDEESNEMQQAPTTTEIVYATLADTPLGGNELKTIWEAKLSPEWPEWKKAIDYELGQLRKMGTWELVNKPDDAIPIANKWVLIKKYNKAGELVWYLLEQHLTVINGHAQMRFPRYRHGRHELTQRRRQRW